MNNQNPPKNFLFFSNHCQHSKQLINNLAKTPLLNMLMLCCADDPNITIPPFITSVPSIYLRDERKVLVEETLYKWINVQLSMLVPNNQQNGQQNPHQNSPPNQSSQPNGQLGSDEIMAFHNSEMGASFSDSYSFIENATDNPIHHSYSFIGGGNNLPSAGTIHTPKEDGNNDTSNSRKVNKSSRLDQKYEEMLSQRQNEMQSSLQNMRM